MSKNGGGEFPSWPDGTAGTPLLNVILDNTPVDDVFLMFHGGDTEFKRKCNEALGNKDYATCTWQPSLEEAERALGSPAPPPDPAALKSGMVRKATYSSSAMGVKFKTEEVIRLIAASPGQGYVVEVCVATTATYGDKFRPVLRHHLQQLGDGRTSLRVVATLVFIKSVNGLLKGMVERGAKDGMGKNLAVVRKVLEGFATVTEAPAAGLPAAAGAAAAAASKPAVAAPAAEGEAPPAALPAPPMLDALAGVPLVQQLRPWAHSLHRLVEPYPVVGALDAEGVLVALAALCLLSTLRLVVDVLRFVHHASEDPQDMVAWLAHYVCKAVDFPDSTREVLMACLLIYLVRALVNRLAPLLPAPPAAATAQPQPAAPAAATTAAAALIAAGAAPTEAAAAAALTAAALTQGHAAAGTPPPPGGLPPGAALGSQSSMVQSLSPVSDGDDLQGVQYEGYAQAIAGMDKQVREGESALSSASSPEPISWSASAQRLNEQMSHQTHKAMKKIKGNFKEFKRSVKALAGSSPSASKSAGSITQPTDKQRALSAADAAAVGDAAVSPGLRGVGRFSSEPVLEREEGSGGEEEDDTAGRSAAASPIAGAPLDKASASTTASVAKPSVGRDSASPNAAPTAEVAAAAAPASAAAAAAAAPAAAANPVAGTGAAVADGEAHEGEGQEGETGSPAAAAAAALGSPPPSRRASATSESGTPSASGGSFFSLKKLAAGRKSIVGEQTPASAKKGEGVLSPDIMSPRSTSSEWELGLSTGRLQGTAPHLMPPGVPPELQPHAVTAEVFENQRLQPFRGWGSTWPGHFLPTDKVNRWSLREVPGLAVKASQEFDQVVPQPPEGWSWVEDSWRIDSTGREIDAVDDEGWAYGLDFGWVQGAPVHPFQANQGKKKVTDFVRRRRWVRTLVPDPSLLPALQQQKLQQAAAPRLSIAGSPKATRPPSAGPAGGPAGPAGMAGPAPGARRTLEGALATARDYTTGEEVGSGSDAAAGAAGAGVGAGSATAARGASSSPSAAAPALGPLAAAAIPLVSLPIVDAGHLSSPPPPASKQAREVVGPAEATAPAQAGSPQPAEGGAGVQAAAGPPKETAVKGGGEPLGAASAGSKAEGVHAQRQHAAAASSKGGEASGTAAPAASSIEGGEQPTAGVSAPAAAASSKEEIVPSTATAAAAPSVAASSGGEGSSTMRIVSSESEGEGGDTTASGAAGASKGAGSHGQAVGALGQSAASQGGEGSSSSQPAAKTVEEVVPAPVATAPATHAVPAARPSAASEASDAEAGARVEQLLSELSSTAGEEPGPGQEQEQHGEGRLVMPEGEVEEGGVDGWEGEDLQIN